MNIKVLFKYYIVLIVIFSTTLLFGKGTGYLKTAGYRASRVMPAPFPAPFYWSRVGNKIAAKFDNTIPAGIWIVSTYLDKGNIQLHFPPPSYSSSYPHISFSNFDKNETYFDEFDSTGVKVWLQVESGDAVVDTLIKLVMDRYQHHPCVIGFGVDVEWFHNSAANIFGKQISNDDAQRWENQVLKYDSSYTLFLKHFVSSFMPPTYRGNIIFIDDSQDFPDLQSMINEFSAWGNIFKNNSVGFQFGYDFDTNGDRKTDKTWWSKSDDPIKEIGVKLFANIKNCMGVYWVDFTIKDLFPVNSITGISQDITFSPNNCQLFQNYPNPFNPITAIKFSLQRESQISIKIFDVMGREIRILTDKVYCPTEHIIEWDAKNNSGIDVPSGVYFYQLKSGDFISTQRCLLVR